MLRDFCDCRSNAHSFISLGQRRYFSLIHYCDAVVGNSSSGLLEVPSFKTPTVNIGDRQKGRLKSPSIIDCNPSKSDILKAITTALGFNSSPDPIEKYLNPYGEGNASLTIIDHLNNLDLSNIKKGFFNINIPNYYSS